MTNGITDKQRIDFYTRSYMPSEFDKAPRPLWSPKATNDNQKRKHTFPALDEARNNTLVAGRTKAETLLNNEWAFDILLEVRDLMDAATPKTAWLQHSGHDQTDEHGPDENPGFGADLIHDYGPSEDRVKRLWEYGNDNKPSKEQAIAQSLGYGRWRVASFLG